MNPNFLKFLLDPSRTFLFVSYIFLLQKGFCLGIKLQPWHWSNHPPPNPLPPIQISTPTEFIIWTSKKLYESFTKERSFLRQRQLTSSLSKGNYKLFYFHCGLIGHNVSNISRVFPSKLASYLKATFPVHYLSSAIHLFKSVAVFPEWQGKKLKGKVQMEEYMIQLSTSKIGDFYKFICLTLLFGSPVITKTII